MTENTLYLPFKPISLARHRTGRHCLYDPQMIVKKNLRAYVKDLGVTYPLIAEPLWLKADFLFQPPKVTSKKKYPLMIGLSYDRKIDLSNILKFYEDAFEGMLWENDCLICDITIKKYYWHTNAVLLCWDIIDEEKRFKPRDFNGMAKVSVG